MYGKGMLTALFSGIATYNSSTNMYENVLSPCWDSCWTGTSKPECYVKFGCEGFTALTKSTSKIHYVTSGGGCSSYEFNTKLGDSQESDYNNQGYLQYIGGLYNEWFRRQ